MTNTQISKLAELFRLRCVDLAEEKGPIAVLLLSNECWPTQVALMRGLLEDIEVCKHNTKKIPSTENSSQREFSLD